MINGRKSGRSRGRRKICCGAAALASCLPLCLTAAEAGEYSEVSTHQTITEETHNTEKTRFAVTDKEQNRGGALLLERPTISPAAAYLKEPRLRSPAAPCMQIQKAASAAKDR